MVSDRIDELMAEAEFFNDNGCDKCAIVTELATIARENAAEADKWRKAVTTRCHVHPSYRGIKRPLDSAKARLGCTCHEHYAALAAVEQEEAE